MFHPGDKIFDKYILIEETNQRKADGHRLWLCQCLHCGLKVVARPGDLSSFKNKSGCPHVDQFGFPSFWGTKYVRQYPNLVSIFNKMKIRCYDTNNKDYQWYGGKGVRVCEEWLQNPSAFIEWSLANHYQEGLTIDRKEPSGDYSPANCQWISREENSRRAGKVNWITVKDMTKTGKQWAKYLSLPVNTINRYIKQYGMEYTINYITTLINQ